MNTRRQYALFIKQVNSFSHWQLCAICTSLAEQSWPNFALFSELTGLNTHDEARHCLNMLWDHVAGRQSSKNFEGLLERLENITPNPEDFDMFGVQPALDTIVNIHCALQCAITPSEEEAASAMTLSLSTIGKFIKYSEADNLKGTELYQYIEQHPLYLSQQGFIDELIKIIVENSKKKDRGPDIETVKEIRHFAKNENYSQLGITL